MRTRIDNHGGGNMRVVPVLFVCALSAGCSSHRGSSASPGAGGGGSQCPTFSNTFDAIQAIIFESHGCTNATCHGASAQAGLDLRAQSSYENLFSVASKGSSYRRVERVQRSFGLRLIRTSEASTS